MLKILEGISRDDVKRSVVLAAKLLFTSLILVYFGGNLVVGHSPCCGIPICDQQWEEFGMDLEDWRQRCWNNSHGVMNCSCCKAEEDYFEERRQAHGQMCFYEGSFPEPYLVALISDGTIQAIDLATLHTTVVLSDLKDVDWESNLAVDYVDKKLYFNHRRRIARANFDGTNMEIIPSQDSIVTFAFDGIGRRLFWVYYVPPRDREIYVGSLDLKFKRRLLTHDIWIPSLAVVPNEGYIFFTDAIFGAQTSLYRSNLAGAAKKKIFRSSPRNSRFVVDYVNKTIYVSSGNSIKSMDYNGNNVVDVTAKYHVNGRIDKGATAILGDMLYWRQWADLITEVNVTAGVKPRQIPITNQRDSSYLVYKLLVVDKSQQTTGGCSWCAHWEYCNNTNGTFSCQCYPGYMHNRNGTNCTDIDECLSSPCGNGTCVNHPGSYKCTCNGSFFEVDNECLATSDVEFMLGNSRNSSRGIINMYHPNFGWRKICDLYWDRRHASVLCRHLGYAGIKSRSQPRAVSRSAGINSYDVQCTGSESSIWDCAKNEWKKVSSCSGDYLEFVSCH